MERHQQQERKDVKRTLTPEYSEHSNPQAQDRKERIHKTCYLQTAEYQKPIEQAHQHSTKVTYNCFKRAMADLLEPE
eukprot:snap_masked-scaffold_29-processed-gene-2.31-mRNA-1 protein AED:1.00 eAED:1.00 QI:0/-1/0/0/-1/1/1/0/76